MEHRRTAAQAVVHRLAQAVVHHQAVERRLPVYRVHPTAANPCLEFLQHPLCRQSLTHGVRSPQKKSGD